MCGDVLGEPVGAAEAPVSSEFSWCDMCIDTASADFCASARLTMALAKPAQREARDVGIVGARFTSCNVACVASC